MFYINVAEFFFFFFILIVSEKGNLQKYLEDIIDLFFRKQSGGNIAAYYNISAHALCVFHRKIANNSAVNKFSSVIINCSKYRRYSHTTADCRNYFTAV